MGILYTAECKKCAYSKKLFTGGGRGDCMPSAYMNELSESCQIKLKNALAEGAVRASVNRIPCLCKDCGEIFTLPVVKYTLKGEQKELKDCCPTCSSENYGLIEDKAVCPQCKAEIVLVQTGLWD